MFGVTGLSALFARPLPSSTAPPSPPESHFTPGDIVKIGGTLIGLRHVSSEEHAAREAAFGMVNGCSLNISFCEGSGFQSSKFHNLHQKIERGEDCTELVAQYESAITNFIIDSLEMDLEEVTFSTDMLSCLEKARFLIVKTTHYFASDTHYASYGGLGRFPKETLPKDDIVRLRTLNKEDLSLSIRPHPIERGDESYTDLLYFIADQYRGELLRFIREDFDRSSFRSMR